MPAFLDINDCNLRLWHGDRKVESPGYALLDGRDYRFGKAARSAARLQPRNINTRYWWQLSVEPLQPPLGPARHTADLVHAHLKELHRDAGEPDELLVATSAGTGREQLSLLLGIVQQCPFEVVGLVNRSTLLASLSGDAGRIFHLEIQLHQAVLCELAVDGGEVVERRSVPLPGCGLLQVQERMVEVMSANFVRQTRFDPRRKAASEQALYDALPGALAELAATAETNLEIEGYRARVSRDDLADAGSRLVESASGAMGQPDNGDRVLGEGLLALLPGIDERLPGLLICEGDASWQAARAHGERLLAGDAGLHFRSALPLLDRVAAIPISPTTIEPVPTGPAPTHVLRGACATPLDRAGQELGTARLVPRGEHWALEGDGVSVNGTPARRGQLLAAGDVVDADGESVTLIAVRSA
jgi:hypothetical protein